MSLETDRKNDDIDLFDLFGRIWRSISSWIMALLQFVLSIVMFLIRRWAYLLAGGLAGVLFTILLKNGFSPVYWSTMDLRTNSISSTEIVGYINRLHSFCLDNNRTALATSLGISEDEAKKIRNIQAFWVIDQNEDENPDLTDFRNIYNVFDTINIRLEDRFAIRAEVYDPADLPVIRDGLVKFVNNNPLFRETNAIRLNQVQEMITRLEYDIRQLDSLQRLKYFEETRSRIPDKTGQMVFLQEQKTQLVYEDIYKLYEKKQKLDTEKNLYSDLITIVNDFTPPGKRHNGLIYYGSYAIPITIAITILILIAVAFRKKISEFLSKY
ncbi:MAG: hypothetical protein U0X39_16240 [Bacteroidales bacterium]